MTVAISLTGGEAHGAWFEGHALEGAPDEIRVAVGGEGGPALLDLPSDHLEFGERVVVYRRVSVGHICSRDRRRGCTGYANYQPVEGLPHPQTPEGRSLRRQLAEEAGVQPPLRVVGA